MRKAFPCYDAIMLFHGQCISYFTSRTWDVSMGFKYCSKPTCVINVLIAGTLGCVFIDNETHESGVTKCTTGEAWSAFSWHHSSVFHCQWTHNQVFLLLSHMLIKNAKSIFIYVMKMCLVSFESWELILHFLSSGLMKLDETICYCWCPIVMKWSLWLQQWSLWLHHCDVIHWDKQSCVTMAVDL